MRLDESVIPEGDYCYDNNKICPYWTRKLPSTKDEFQICAEESKNKVIYCRYLKKSEADSDCSLLPDQTKECGVNKKTEDNE